MRQEKSDSRDSQLRLQSADLESGRFGVFGNERAMMGRDEAEVIALREERARLFFERSRARWQRNAFAIALMVAVLFWFFDWR